MEEKRTGGMKEFVLSVVWAAALLCIGRMIIFALPEYKVIGTLITLVMFCILGYYVLTRYSAVYTYSLKNNRLRINRTIGGRNKEVELSVSGIKSVTHHRPKGSPRALHMRTTVFSHKNLWYIVYRKNNKDNLLVCTMSEKMAAGIKRDMKHAK